MSFEFMLPGGAEVLEVLTNGGAGVRVMDGIIPLGQVVDVVRRGEIVHHGVVSGLFRFGTKVAFIDPEREGAVVLDGVTLEVGDLLKNAPV